MTGPRDARALFTSLWPRCSAGWLLVVASTFAALLLACGGSPPAEAPPSSDSSPQYGSDYEEAADEEPVAEVGPDCSDGTCFVCGKGSCPLGAYCDEGSGACAWIAECSGTPSCACLTRVLGEGCSCSESGGGPQVSCAP